MRGVGSAVVEGDAEGDEKGWMTVGVEGEICDKNVAWWGAESLRGSSGPQETVSLHHSTQYTSMKGNTIQQTTPPPINPSNHC